MSWEKEFWIDPNRPIKKILFIGFTNPEHASSYMAKGFRALGYEVNHVDPYQNELIDFTRISEVYTNEDFVYVFHNNSKRLIADVPVPVVYYHFELLWRATIDECDILIMASPLIENGLVYWYPEVFKRNPAKYIQYYGVDLDVFDATEKKKYLKCTFMGNTEWKEKCWLEKDIYKTRKRVVEACEPYLNIMPHDDYLDYVNDLKHAQSTLIVHGRQCYISQRIFEAAAASCCPIIYVDDEIGQKTYSDIGLVNRKNCIMLYDTDPSVELNLVLKTHNLTQIGKNARKWVESRNNINNCKEVIKYVEQYKKQMEKRKEHYNLRSTRLIESQLRIDL